MYNISSIIGSPFLKRLPVRVISDEDIKEFPVQSSGFPLNEGIGVLPVIIEQIILKLEENLKSQGRVEILKKKLFLNSGGLNGTYLAADLMSLDNDKKLLVSLNRIGDASADTCAIYWIRCPEKLNDDFKDFLRKTLRKNILELCEGLFIRASVREKVIPHYKEFKESLIRMN